MARRQWSWTDFQLDKLNKVVKILDELSDYKPLTLRQVYYQLVGKGYIENTQSEYTQLSTLLKWARIDREISWNDIEDRTRTYNDLTGYSDSERYLKAYMDYIFDRYQRNLLSDQDKYIEIWIEKDALSSIFVRTASPYTIPVVVCRGFSSVSFLHEFEERIDNTDRKPLMLYFGDFDPSGVEMLEAMETTIKYEFGIKDIEFKRIALLKDDIFKYNLPHSPKALKKTDSRANKHIEKYGELAVELDALRPDILVEKIRTAIVNEIDVDRFEDQKAIFQIELDKLNVLKGKVLKLL